jgi:hypothetical protein
MPELDRPKAMLDHRLAPPQVVRLVGHALRHLLDDRRVLPALDPPIVALVALRALSGQPAQACGLLYSCICIPAWHARFFRQELADRAAVRVPGRLEDEVCPFDKPERFHLRDANQGSVIGVASVIGSP